MINKDLSIIENKLNFLYRLKNVLNVSTSFKTYSSAFEESILSNLKLLLSILVEQCEIMKSKSRLDSLEVFFT